MHGIVNSLLISPLLKLGTWVKRHPGVTLLVLLVLFTLPPLIVVAFGVWKFVCDTLAKIKALASVVEKVRDAGKRVLNWIAAEKYRSYLVGFLISIFFPLFGALLFSWLFLDRFKRGTYVVDQSTTTLDPQVPLKPTLPDLGIDDSFPDFDDYTFNA